MFNIFSKKITLVAFAILFAWTANAQIRGTYNYLDFANKPYYFGITLAYNSSNYHLVHSNEFILHDSIRTAESILGPGFNLGIVTNLKIGRYFDFRFLPTLSFTDRNIQFNTAGSELPVNKRIESVFVELPFHVRYKSEPYKDLRVFVVGGVKYSFDVASNSRTRQAPDLIQISPTDFAIEAGVGLQFFFPYFIFSPELKFSYGLSNAQIYNPNLQFSTVLEKIMSRTITISFHFEG